jgi:hypothetical protein
VVLQLHGVADHDAVASLVAAGPRVIEIDAYRLSLPIDPSPAQDLIRAACAAELAALTFVTAAIHNLSYRGSTAVSGHVWMSACLSRNLFRIVKYQTSDSISLRSPD